MALHPAVAHLEPLIAIPTGQTETGSGSCVIDGGVIRIDTDATVACTPKAKQVERIVRTLQFSGDDFGYEMSMAAVGQPLTHHLRSQLTRAAE